MTTPQRLTDPASIFLIDWSRTGSGWLALEVWIRPQPVDSRGVIDAALTISLDPTDATLAPGAGTWSIPTDWTGLAGGTTDITLVLFNSTENPSIPGAQIYVDPVVETSGAHAGMQKLASVILDANPLATAISPIRVSVDEFTDVFWYTYTSSPTGAPMVAEIDLSIDLSGEARVLGTTGNDATLNAGTAKHAIVTGNSGDDIAINLSSGDTFIGGTGRDTAHFPGQSSTYSVKLASSDVEASLAVTGEGAVEAGVPLFAISETASTGEPAYVQAEALRFGTSTTTLTPLRLLNTGTPIKLVDASDHSAFASISLALASASAGDSIVVAKHHQESGEPLLNVVVNDIRVMLLNPTANGLTFRLQESSSVMKFTLLGSGSADIVGNAYANTLIGNDADNRIDGGGGNDVILGGDGADRLSGGTGNDWIDGNAGWDSAFGGAGNDVLYADHGGASGVPAPSDMLIGGSGADLLIAGGSSQPGAIRMMGGSGADVFRLMSVEGIDGTPDLQKTEGFDTLIADFTGADGIDLSAIPTGLSGTALTARVSMATPPDGDLCVSLAGLVMKGLQGPVPDSGDRAVAPSVTIATNSTLVVSMAADAAAISAAMERASALQSQADAGYGRSAQVLFDSVAPIYLAHDRLLDQLVFDLSPVG